jgi:PAS domain S-box-containing protein
MVPREVAALVEGEALQRLRSLLEDREDAAIVVCDEQTRVLWARGPGLRGLLGYALPEVEGRDLPDLAHPADAVTVRVGFETAVAGHSVRLRFRARTTDGRWPPTSATCWAVGRSSPVCVVAILVPEGVEPDVLDAPFDLSRAESRGIVTGKPV